MGDFTLCKMNRREDGFYLGDEYGKFYLKVQNTSDKVIFKSYDQEDTCRINHYEIVYEIAHDESVKPLPEEELIDVVKIIGYWIPQRQEWIGFLFTITDDFVDLEIDYPEKRVYYSPPYLLPDDVVARPSEEELRVAAEKNQLVERTFNYQEFLKSLAARQ